MKAIFTVFALFSAAVCASGAMAANTGTVLRGNAGLANAYKTNQKNTYYMVQQPDVDTACREKIFKCLSEYCGDVTIVPGQRSGRCQYASETELYNYAILCLQKDTSVLLPQYNTNLRTGGAGMNTAARLCPSYIQQELMSYLSMANMADQLSKSHSSLCLQRRQELEAAMACHTVALMYGNETSSMLSAQLTDACGAGVPGGSAEMVTRFSSAGNVGANVWGWAEKLVNLDMNKKGTDWQNAVDAVLAGYTNRMNLACGDNMKVNTVPHTSGNNQPSTLQTVATLAVGATMPKNNNKVANPYEGWSVFQEVTSMSEIYNSATAKQVVVAALTNNALTQNNFLTSAQMSDMQTAYTRGTKVFIIRDSARCYIVPVAEMTDTETSVVAHAFANCLQ